MRQSNWSGSSKTIAGYPGGRLRWINLCTVPTFNLDWVDVRHDGGRALRLLT